jgi:hypothetical protein
LCRLDRIAFGKTPAANRIRLRHRNDLPLLGVIEKIACVSVVTAFTRADDDSTQHAAIPPVSVRTRAGGGDAGFTEFDRLDPARCKRRPSGALPQSCARTFSWGMLVALFRKLGELGEIEIGKDLGREAPPWSW